MRISQIFNAPGPIGARLTRSNQLRSASIVVALPRPSTHPPDEDELPLLASVQGSWLRAVDARTYRTSQSLAGKTGKSSLQCSSLGNDLDATIRERSGPILRLLAFSSSLDGPKTKFRHCVKDHVQREPVSTIVQSTKASLSQASRAQSPTSLRLLE
ncbi:hypothetical protein J6590_066239 [Homalodisca vitripennis]|nr:hypothetical protein J6590_066239 [Homalodisca vitripennis]